jgi:hypothetical protein
VGGTGQLSMVDLKARCEDSGFTKVQTCVAGGNVAVKSSAAPKKVKAELAARLLAYMGKPVRGGCPGVRQRGLADGGGELGGEGHGSRDDCRRARGEWGDDADASAVYVPDGGEVQRQREH